MSTSWSQYSPASDGGAASSSRSRKSAICVDFVGQLLVEATMASVVVALGVRLDRRVDRLVGVAGVDRPARRELDARRGTGASCR